MHRFYFLLVFIIAIAIHTSHAHAQAITAETVTTTPAERVDIANRGFLRDGIFGCQAGRFAMPVGTLQAIGGVYVPVNDAAVTQNTGYLVYKECVLDGVVVRMREAATGAIVRSMVTWGNRGSGGNPQFVDNVEAYRRAIQDQTALESLKRYNFTKACSPYRDPLRARLASEYIAYRGEKTSLTCSPEVNQERLNDCFEGKFTSGCGGLSGYFKIVSDPNSVPVTALIAEKGYLIRRVTQASADEEMMLSWANGWKSVKETKKTPTETGEDKEEKYVITPGTVISQAMSQAIGSGFRQLENASEIDQIVNALFSGITNQIVTDVRGLRGLNESRLGKPPYLDQLSAESSAGVRNAASNAGLSILNPSLATEEAFNKSKRKSKSSLEDAAAQIRRAEDRCWELIIPAVQQYAKDVACTTVPGTTVIGGGALGGVINSPPVTTCNPPAELRISTSTEIIKSGTIALAVATGSAVTSGAPYVFNVSPTTVIPSGSFQVAVNQAQTYASSTQIGLSINETVPAPKAGGTLAIATAAIAPFGSGTLSLTLAPGKELPLGEVRFPLVSIPPFIQAAVSLLVNVAQPFADAVIEDKITPSVETVNGDIADSDEALTQLTNLVNDLRNTESLTAQRVALERLDTLVAQGILHDAYDVKEADQQSEAVEGSMNTLVEDTVTEWGSGGGWCNTKNTNVVKMWYERWKVD